MNTRTRIVFTINNEVVIEEYRELSETDIEKMKWVIVEECSCHYDEIAYEIMVFEDDLSEIDVTYEGLMDWRDWEGRILSGIGCTLKVGSDEYLDAINKGTIINFLEFY